MKRLLSFSALGILLGSFPALAAAQDADREQIRGLLSQLQDGMSDRAMVLEQLADAGGPPVARRIVTYLEDENSSVVQSALRSLGRLKADQYADRVARLLVNPDEGVRGEARKTLRRMGVTQEMLSRYSDFFLKSLGSEDDYTRWIALDLLGELGDKRFVKNITEALNSDDSDVTRAGLRALARINDRSPETIENVVSWLVDGDSDTVREARRTLKALGVPNEELPKYVDVVVRYLDGDNADEAGRLLKKYATQDNIPKLGEGIAKFLKHRDSDVRERALDLLGELGAREQKEAVAKLLNSRDNEIRGRAALALGRMGAEEYTDRIGRLLVKEGGTDRDIRPALEALRELGASSQLGRVQELLNDPGVG